jgi:hypothetical protein
VDGDIVNNNRVWNSCALILNGPHVDLVTESNALRSLATGAMPRLFERFNDSIDYTFELFNQPERIALQPDFNDIEGQHKDYNEDDKIQMQT